MEKIANADSRILDFLNGVQIYDEKKEYRFATWILMEPVNSDVTAVYNVFNKSCFLISNEELETVFEDKQSFNFICLMEMWSIVPKDYKEYKVIDTYRDFVNDKNKTEPFEYINNYVILPTTDCNARCFYCYEKGCDKFNMTIETAEKVANFIISHRNPKKTVKLSWFGGEPLYNSEIIDVICKRLNENNVDFTSDVTTNGSLLNEDMMKKAVKEWRTITAQITMDGTEEVYNKVKHYVDKNIKNPYETVMNNISILSKNGVSVSVRMNMDLYNFSNLKELVKELSERFKNNKNVNPYVHEIFEDPQHPRTEEEKKELYEKLNELEEYLYDLGYFKKMPEDTWFHACMGDSGNSIVISPTGKITVCEHFYGNNHIIGDIDTFDEKKDWEEINRWKEKSFFKGLCEACPVYSTCYSLKLCENANCNKYYRDSKIYKTKIEIRNLVKNHMERNKPVTKNDYDMLVNDFSRLYDKVQYMNEKIETLTKEISELKEKAQK